VIVLAFDPGKMTGYVVWNDVDGIKLSGQCDQRDFRFWAETFIETYAVWDLHVVGEEYRISMETVRKAKDAHWPLDVIGAVRHFCEKQGLELEQQSASKAKSFATDAKLRKLEWYESTPGGHRNDAVRHLTVWLVDLCETSHKSQESAVQARRRLIRCHQSTWYSATRQGRRTN